MPCSTYKPEDGPLCSWCEGPDTDHPKLGDGTANPTWAAPPLSHWRHYKSRGEGSPEHWSWGDFTVMVGSPISHVTNCECDGDEYPPDSRCVTGPDRVMLWADHGGHGYEHLWDLGPDNVKQLVRGVGSHRIKDSPRHD